jgi:ATP-dependent RNA helicase RhlE
MTFNDLQLTEPVMKAIQTEGYTIPTPVQIKAIPLVLKRKDIICCAQTGTGKTAAFAIPMIQLMCQDNKNDNPRAKRVIRALILTPTRELAIQIGESFAAYGKNTSLRYKVVYGGVSQHGQVEALKSGIDVLIATPGRLLDLTNQGYVNLSNINYFVLDEADRMLDMGFVQDVRKIITRLPQKKQSLFFSATMPRVIADLADTILVNPARVEVTPVSSTVNTIRQVVYFVDKKNKNALLKDVLSGDTIDRALVFTRTKHGADRVARDLSRAGINSQAIHGNKSQNARQNALSSFKSNHTRVLVATDIAARGIDIEELSHVINFELPNIPESYVHRIGRTGRAGAEGMAIAFCDAGEKAYLNDIQKLIGKVVPVVADHAYPLMDHDVEKVVPGANRGRRNGNSRSESSSSGNGKFRNGNSGGKNPAKGKGKRVYY